MLKSPHKKISLVNSLEKLFIIKFVKLVILEVGELYIPLINIFLLSLVKICKVRISKKLSIDLLR